MVTKRSRGCCRRDTRARYPPRTMLPATALGAAMLFTARPACPAELFRVTRSKNANVVVYELHLGKTGELDPAGMVRASWLMLAEDGRREGLSGLERMLAFGFDVRSTSEGLRIVLKADRSHEIEIREHAGCLRAVRLIAGRPALLQVIYVDTVEGFPLPSVRRIEVSGVDLETGAAVREAIVPR